MQQNVDPTFNSKCFFDTLITIWDWFKHIHRRHNT